MTAIKPALPEALQVVAASLLERTRFPIEMWETTPPEDIIAAVSAIDGILGTYPGPVFAALVKGWRRSIEDWKLSSKDVRANESKVVETLASTIGKLSSTGAVGADGYIKAKNSYYHGLPPTNGFQVHILSSVGLANFPGEPSWADTRWVLSPSLWPTHPDAHKRGDISSSLADIIYDRVDNYMQAAKSSGNSGLVGWWDSQLRMFRPMVSTFVTLMRGMNAAAGDFTTSEHAVKVLEVVQSQVETLECAIKVMILKVDQCGKLPPPCSAPGRPAVPFWLVKFIEERKDAVDRKNQKWFERERGRGGSRYYGRLQDRGRQPQPHQYEDKMGAQDVGGRGGSRGNWRGGNRGGRGGYPDKKRLRQSGEGLDQEDSEKT